MVPFPGPGAGGGAKLQRRAVPRLLASAGTSARPPLISRAHSLVSQRGLSGQARGRGSKT